MHLTLFGRRAGQPSCATSQSSSTSSKSSKVLAVREKRAATLTPISSRSSALDWSITLAELAGDFSNMLQSTPAAAAAALLTAVLKTIAAVKVNQEQCLRIGERAARALAALGVQMEGKWDTAPQSLLDNLYALESTLSGLQDSMRRLSQANWRKRLLSKSQIEDTLQQCELRLDEALQCFQFTSLIQIHYAFGSRQDRCVSNGDLTVAMSSDVPEPAPSTTTAGGLEEFLATLREPEDDFGFRRYHPSEVVLSKPNPWRSGWFSELSDAQALGSKAVVKGYTGTREEALKHWYQDVKRLRNIYHPRFPQLLGYSNGKAPTPFIILSSAPKQDVVSYLQAWWTPQLSLTDSTLALLRAYRDISGAVLYAQQQLSLDNQGMKEFIRNATYAVDHNQSLILGLPVQIDDNFVQQRWTKVVGDAYLPRTIFYHYLTRERRPQ
ncbi:hypothetical protein FA95DRAFT_1325870 [Auriscalpium vulgare]|uniref:Uncharacterized protein n=1 Tax=Auriscalpium vulgare TaxID=40419 RepID=A0ACB8S8H1_9AGAM|nr:hypothetical protein FA95DRAFT_1325870 [Auriscalpium vulgare]